VSPRVSIIVPAFNEEALLAASLDAIEQHCERAGLAHELIVVDDGSVDATRPIALRFAAHRPHVTIVGLDTNVGLGGALRAGIEASIAPVIVTLDADLTYAPEHIERLVAACSPSTAIVIASPYAPGGRVTGVPRHRLALSRFANRLLARRLGLATSTSMVRAYSREFVLPALATIENRDVSLGLLRAAKQAGRTVLEVPAHLDWSGVPDRASRLRTRDSIAAVVRAWRGSRR
jgi:glycosyltransferase involved in cell wall biosynthesis